MAGVARAVYDVAVDWSVPGTIPSGGFFVLDSSTLNSGDMLAVASGYAAYFLGPYDRLTAPAPAWPVRIETLRWSRGHNEPIERVEAGRAVITVRDYLGLLNPNNAASPILDRLVPMRPVRIQATFASVLWPLYVGYIRTIDWQAAARGGTAVLTCEDLLLRLSRSKPIVAAITDGTNAEAVVGLILDAVGFTDPALRDLSDGTPIPSWPGADGTRSALDLISDVLEVTAGRFYVTAAGVATLADRYSIPVKTPAYTISEGMRALGPGVSLDTIINQQTATRTGGPPQTYEDATSSAAYGLSSGSPIESSLFVDDAAALALATFIVSLWKDPHGPMHSLDVDGRLAALLTAILDTDFQDLLVCTAASTGVTGTYVVERLEHTLDQADGLHKASYIMTETFQSVAGLFILDSSTLDGVDVLAA